MLNDAVTWTLYLQAAVLAIGWAAYSGLLSLNRKEEPDALHALLRGHLLVAPGLDTIEKTQNATASEGLIPSGAALLSNRYPLDDDRRNPRGLALEGCQSCDGDGCWTCSDCDGEGEDEDGNPCDECDGTGEIECEACKGYGTVLSLP